MDLARSIECLSLSTDSSAAHQKRLLATHSRTSQVPFDSHFDQNPRNHVFHCTGPLLVSSFETLGAIGASDNGAEG